MIHTPEQTRVIAVSSLFLLLLVALVISGITWASMAEIDEVTRGSGRVIPSRQVQIIQNLEGGILSELKVKEGDVVFGENQVNKNPNIVNDVRSEIEEEILRYRNNNKISAQENAIQENLSDKEITSVETTFYCATCGNSFGTEDKFCSNCGSEIK